MTIGVQRTLCTNRRASSRRTGFSETTRAYVLDQTQCIRYSNHCEISESVVEPDCSAGLVEYTENFANDPKSLQRLGPVRNVPVRLTFDLNSLFSKIQTSVQLCTYLTFPNHENDLYVFVVASLRKVRVNDDRKDRISGHLDLERNRFLENLPLVFISGISTLVQRPDACSRSASARLCARRRASVGAELGQRQHQCFFSDGQHPVPGLRRGLVGLR